jgi:hypothetical protein
LLRAVATTTGSGAALYPATASALVDDWLAVAAALDGAAATWLEPGCRAASAEQRAEAQRSIESVLDRLDGQLAQSAYLVWTRPARLPACLPACLPASPCPPTCACLPVCCIACSVFSHQG